MNDAYRAMVQVDRKYGEKQAKQVQTPKEKHRQNFRNMKVQDVMSMADDDFDDGDYKMFDE